ncbi:filamentous hemagglutinin [Dyadobacter sp. CY343]|uniref:filamentous hemagglutinin n=1 Tax=Dyadobacter sp. CY343 TaxID=2907299 RepID=UPI001F46E64F|nr:filamentous hemagglutinin [Dyadobacter sp. CY343]MCE7058536.1 filamentous hemagglutinin [Dyadobacter sp. CY343]
MDIYQMAANYWDAPSNGGGDPAGLPETPPFDPRPEVPSPDVPEETPPFEREPETPPIEPNPGIPPVEPGIPEVEPIREPGGEPDIPAFN